jgi:hypothetical protein
VIADQFYWRKCPGAGAVLTFNHAGRYVRIIDERIGRNTVFALFLPFSPESLSPRQPNPTATATVAGPVATAPWKPESTCGLPPPRVKLKARAARRGKRLEIGSVACLVRCEIRVGLATCDRFGTPWQVQDCLEFGHREKTVRLSFRHTFPGGRGASRLLIPSQQSRRIGFGIFDVSVSVNGGEKVELRQLRVPRAAVETKSKR